MMGQVKPVEAAGIAAVLAAMAVAVLDLGLVTVALPTIAKALNASAHDIVLVLGAYQLALLIGLLPAAHLAERWGYRRLFRVGIAIFLASALACLCARSLEHLILARFAQGLGAAGIMALGIALLRAALGDGRLSAAIAWNALTVAVCSAAAPAIGSVLLAAGSWRAVFLAGIPLGVFALVASLFLPEARGDTRHTDIPSIVIYAMAASLLFLAARLALDSPFFAATAALFGLIAAYLLARRQYSSNAPLVPIDLLSTPVFGASVLASICCFTAQSAGVSALSFYLQDGLHESALMVGMILTCWPLSVMAASLASRRLAGRLDARTRCTAGAALLAAGSALGGGTPPTSGVWVLAVAALACGAGFGLFQLANNETLFLGVRPERSAAAGGIQGTARLAGQTLGTLVVGLVFSSVPSGLVSPRVTLFVGALFAIAAAIISALRPSSRSIFP